MKPYLTLILLASCFACNNEGKKNVSDPSNSTKTINSRIARIEEEVRLPKSEFEICEGGIGVVKLGDLFSSIDHKFSKVDTLTMSSEGEDWPAKRIDLGNGEWILVESTTGGDSGDVITRLHTNSRKYRTPKDFHIGQSFSEILKSGEEIGVDIDEGTMSIRLYGEKISVQLDSVSVSHFYNSANHAIKDIPKNAVIVEFVIY